MQPFFTKWSEIFRIHSFRFIFCITKTVSMVYYNCIISKITFVNKTTAYHGLQNLLPSGAVFSLQSSVGITI